MLSGGARADGATGGASGVEKRMGEAAADLAPVPVMGRRDMAHGRAVNGRVCAALWGVSVSKGWCRTRPRETMSRSGKLLLGRDCGGVNEKERGRGRG